jgi:hypothetical protein
MRIFLPLVLLVLVTTPSQPTQAADLNGAWTIDATSCAQVFTKQDNKIAFRKDADFNAGGLIVEGKKITGTFQKCTVKSFREDGPNMKVIASCSDGVAFSDTAFDLKFTGDNAITLSQKEPVAMEMPYVRCSM